MVRIHVEIEGVEGVEPLNMPLVGMAQAKKSAQEIVAMFQRNGQGHELLPVEGGPEGPWMVHTPTSRVTVAIVAD